jgi:hypothetical protein
VKSPYGPTTEAFEIDGHLERELRLVLATPGAKSERASTALHLSKTSVCYDLVTNLEHRLPFPSQRHRFVQSFICIHCFKVTHEMNIDPMVNDFVFDHKHEDKVLMAL